MSLYKRLHEVEGSDPNAAFMPPTSQLPNAIPFLAHEVAEQRAEQLVQPTPAKFLDSGEVLGVHPFVAVSFSKEAKSGRNLVEPNEDGCFVDPTNGAFFVADGVGGHAGGPEASQAALKAFANLLSGTKPNVEDAKKLMIQGLADARRAVADKQVELGQDASNKGRMATTITGGMVIGSQLVAVNAGDSAIKIKRGGEIIDITTEQGENNQINNGIFGLTDSGISHSPATKVQETRPAIYEHSQKANVDESDRLHKDEIIVVDLEVGDRIFAVTDGILGDWEKGTLPSDPEYDDRMKEEQFIEALAEPEPRIAASKLIAQSAKYDDTTVVIVDYNPVAKVAPITSAPTPRPSKAKKDLNTGNAVKDAPPTGKTDLKTSQSHPDAPPTVDRKVSQEPAEKITEVSPEVLKRLGDLHDKFIEINVNTQIGKRRSKKDQAVVDEFYSLISAKKQQSKEVFRDVNGITDEAELKGLVEYFNGMYTDQLKLDVISSIRSEYISLSAKNRTREGSGGRKLKQLHEAYVRLRDQEGVNVGIKMRQAGYSEAEVNEFGAVFGIEASHQLQQDITAATINRGPKEGSARAAFAQWWDRQGGHKFLSKEWVAGNVKRGLVLAPVSIATGAAGVFALGGVGAGVVGAVMARSVSRSFVTAKLSRDGAALSRKDVQALSDHGYDEDITLRGVKIGMDDDVLSSVSSVIKFIKANPAEYSSGNTKEVIQSFKKMIADGDITPDTKEEEQSMLDLVERLADGKVITTSDLLDQTTARSEAIRKKNRNRFLATTAISAAAGLAGAAAADFLHNHLENPFSHSGGNTTPPTTVGNIPPTTAGGNNAVPPVGGTGSTVHETSTTVSGTRPAGPGTSVESTTSTTTPNSTTSTTVRPSSTTTSTTAPTTTSTTGVPKGGGSNQPAPSAGNVQPQPNAAPNTQGILGPDGKPYTQAELDRIFKSPEFKTMADSIAKKDGQFESYVKISEARANADVAQTNLRVTEQLAQIKASPEANQAFQNMVDNPVQFHQMLSFNAIAQHPTEFAAMIKQPQDFTNMLNAVDTLHQTYPHFQGPQFEQLFNQTLGVASIREQLLAQGKTPEEVEEILKSYFSS